MDNSIKDKVLESTDIVAVIGERVALTRKGKEFVGLCPFHADHRPSLNVSPSKQIFKCWACGAGGDVIKFVQLRERVEFREALDLLAQRAGIEVRGRSPEGVSAAQRDELLRTIDWARARFEANLSAPSATAAREYASRRGLSGETVAAFQIGLALEAWDDLVGGARRSGITDEMLVQAGLAAIGERGKVYDRFRNRLIFPIRDALGRVVAFGGRTLGDDPAKYLNSPETALFSKSRLLYGFDRARSAIEKDGAAVVVEGYLDAVLLHQAGFGNVVATLGTALTDAHVKVLQRVATGLVLCFDGDTAGLKAADRAVEVAIGSCLAVRVVSLPGDQDPADLVLASGKSGFERVLQSAQDALGFKWSLTQRAIGNAGPAARRAAIEEFVRFIAKAGASGGIDPLAQGLLVGRLGELLRVPPESVYSMLAAARRPRYARADLDDAAPPVASAYQSTIRGLPAGLVAAAEDVLGVLLTDASAFDWSDHRLDDAFELCEPWRRLMAMCHHLREERGGPFRADVVGACDDAVLAELISIACARVSSDVPLAEQFRQARVRLDAELELRTLHALQTRLAAAPSEERGDETFRELLAAGRRQSGPLAPASRALADAGSP